MTSLVPRAPPLAAVAFALVPPLLFPLEVAWPVAAFVFVVCVLAGTLFPFFHPRATVIQTRGHAPPFSNNLQPGSVCSLGLTGPERRFCHCGLNHR
jgi:hypothetical protein